MERSFFYNRADAVARKKKSLILVMLNVICGFHFKGSSALLRLLQSSSLLTLCLPSLFVSPILLVCLQQTKSNALLRSLLGPWGDEKSLAVVLDWPALLAENHLILGARCPRLCVSVCFSIVCLNCRCFVK